VPEPVKGFDKNYDRAQNFLLESTQALDEYLKEIKNLFPSKKHLV